MSDADFKAILEDPQRMSEILNQGLETKMSELAPDVGGQLDKMIEEMGQRAAKGELPDHFKKAYEMLCNSRKKKGESSQSSQPEAKPAFLDIDKAWQGIHFLLTGSESGGSGPLAFILQGGREIPCEDFGYGPPHAFTPAEVKEIDRALSQIDPQELYDKADPAQLSALDIYPGIWDDEPKEESIGYLTHYLKELKTFVKKTAESNRALIAYIS